MTRYFSFARVCVRAIVVCALGLALVSVTVAAPGREPVLRIETGAHLAAITRISADKEGRWIVTGSEDKTVRLWDGRTAQALTVLRPPLGPENIGAVYAAAISPDGRSVAMGGNSDFGDGSGHLMHLFDRASASVPPKSTLTGFEAPLTQLAWSPDSQLIAIGLRQQGLRVFRRDLQGVGIDPEFNEAIFGADFSVDGRLAVASLDGAIRLYRIGRGGLERVARFAAPGGKPYGLMFSPDGKTLAVGYQDQARVDVLDASTFKPVHRIDLGRGNLGRVAWSHDGTTLFAAGGYVRNGRFPVLAFGNQGTAAATEVGSFSNTILSLAALPGGQIAAASAEPGWAVFSLAGQRVAGSQPQSADLRDSGTQFRLSADASVLAFALRAGAESLVFDLNAGSLKTMPPPDKVAPALQSGAPFVDNWHNAPTPRVNGLVLALKQGELSRSLAIQASDRSFVLGTDWFVRRYTPQGVPLWESRIAAPAWAINLSADGRWVVAGLGDGSIRWFRAQDGVEQLALFAHADKTRWIVWTPTGYYDTSVGGEGLVGWHLNRAFNQSADFFSAGRFRDRLYRSDVIQKVLGAGDEQAALRAAQADLAAFEAANTDAPAQALASPPKTQVLKGASAKSVVAAVSPDLSAALPPVVELRSSPQVESGAATVPVRFEVRSPGNAPVLGFRARVNGKLVRELKGKGLRATGVQEIEVPVPASGAEILLFAENRHGKSDPVSVKVSPAPESGPLLQAEKYEKLYLLIVGISKYPANPLDLASKDARDFSHQMAKQTGQLYASAVPKLLIDEQATRQNILDGLQWLRDSVGEKDAGVVFFAGHGHNIGASYFFIPSDTNAFPAPGEVKSEVELAAWHKKNASSVWVPGDEIARTLQNLKGRAVFFVDTCHAGALARQATRGSSDMTGTLNSLGDEKGVIVFASSTSRELSQEDPAWGNGAFTKAVIEGIKGDADKDKTGLIRPSYLSAYVSDRVRALTKGEQRPTMLTVDVDDPIASKTR